MTGTKLEILLVEEEVEELSEKGEGRKGTVTPYMSPLVSV